MRTSDALLRMLPGFDRTRSNSAFTNYGQLRASFSGAGSDRGLVLVNGLPADDGFGGQIDWAAYPADEIVRAELFAGAGSALYGSGAVGGVLDVDTFGPRGVNEPAQGRLDVDAGTQYLGRLQMREEGRLAPRLTGALSYDASTESAYIFPPGYRSAIDSDATSKTSVFRAGARYGVGGAVLGVDVLSAYDAQHEGRPNYSFDRKVHQYDVRYEQSWGENLVRVLGFARDGVVENQQDEYPKSPGTPLYFQRVPTHESMIAATYEHVAPRSQFDVRGDFRDVAGTADQFAPSGALESQGTGAQRLSGLAIQETVGATSRFEAVAGARIDDVALRNAVLVAASGATGLPGRDDAAVSPRLAARYDVTPGVAVRASIGAGFRAPFLNELLRSFNVAGIEMLGNPNLLPERSSTASGGIDVARGAWRTALDFFHTSVHDAIAFVTQTPSTQMRENLERTQTDGAMLSFSLGMSRCLRVSANATSQDARVVAGPVDAIGKRLAFVPDTSASIAIAGCAGKIDYGFVTTYLGPTYADDLNMQPLGTAVVFGLHVSAPVGRGVRATLAADNLSAQTYRSSLDRLGPPPTVSVGLRVPLGTGE